MPEIMTAPASVNANSLNRLPVRPPEKPIGAYTANKVIVIAMTGSGQFPCPDNCGFHRGHSVFDMTLNVFDNDDGIIDDEPDGQNHCEQRSAG